MNVTRSIVHGVVGPCKTESLQKPVPFHALLAIRTRKRVQKGRQNVSFCTPDGFTEISASAW
jgi:hypothetical protein